MDILQIINKFNNYNIKCFDSITDFVNSFCLDNNNNSFLNVMCTNNRSYKANVDLLHLLLENDPHYKKIDILIPTETWHYVADCVYSISGYDRYLSLIKRNQNDSLIIFVKQGLTIDLYEYGCKEGNILKLSVFVNNKTIYI